MLDEADKVQALCGSLIRRAVILDTCKVHMSILKVCIAERAELEQTRFFILRLLEETNHPKHLSTAQGLQSKYIPSVFLSSQVHSVISLTIFLALLDEPACEQRGENTSSLVMFYACRTKQLLVNQFYSQASLAARKLHHDGESPFQQPIPSADGACFTSRFSCLLRGCSAVLCNEEVCLYRSYKCPTK